MKRISPLISCLWLCVLLDGNLMAQGTQTKGPAPFTGLDLIVLVDNSGSMWGWKDAGFMPNDPYNFRISGTHSVIDRLIDHVEGTPFMHRVSVIEFGNEANVLISQLEVKYDKVPNWKAKYISEKNKIKNNLLKNTNTAAAFKMAEVEVAKMTATGPQAGRRRVVLLITDGRPAMPTISQSILKRDTAVATQHMQAHGFELWVLAMNAVTPYWDNGEDAFWISLTGSTRACLAKPILPVMPNIFNNYVDDWLAINSQTAEETYICPPYLKRLTFQATFDKPGGSARILDPNGNALPSVGSQAHSTNARFERLYPVPGTYKIDKHPNRLTYVRAETTPSDIVRIEPAGPVDPGLECPIIFEARDGKGKVLEQLPGYPIQASIEISGPDGSVAEITAKCPDSKLARFETKWTPAQTGTWRVRLIGWVTLPDGSKVDVFLGNGHSYNEQILVTNREAYRLRVENPEISSGFRVKPWSEEAKVSMVLVDKSGAPVTDLSQLVADPATWLKLVCIDQTGRPLSGPIPLKLNSDGQFEATITLKPEWWKGMGTLYPDQAYLKVEATEPIAGEKYLHSIALPSDLADHRVGGDPMTVGPLKVKIPGWLWFPIWFLVLLLLAPLLRWLVTRWLPDWSMAKKDKKSGKKMILQIYDEVVDPMGINAIEYSVTGAARFDFTRKLQLDVGGHALKAAHFLIVRRAEGGREKAHLTYAWKIDGGKKMQPKTITLNMSMPMRLDGIPGSNFVVKLADKNTLMN